MGNRVVFLFIVSALYYLQSCKQESTAWEEIQTIEFDTIKKETGAEAIILNTVDHIYDADGNAYATITIGDQTWMAENLRTTTCWDGSVLGNIPIGKTSKDPAVYWVDNDANSEAAQEYGPLYNWAALNNCDLCPKNYKIPTEIEWRKLLRFWYGKNGVPAGGKGLTYASYKLREPGNRLWSQIYHYTDTIPAIGYDGKPGGWLEDGRLQYYGERTGWWGLQDSLPVISKMADGDGGVWIADATPDYSNYIRCIKFK